MDNSAAAAAMFGGMMIVWAIVALGFTALWIWFFWRILERTGQSGALSLLNLIPGVGNLVVVLILAFGAWPLEDRAAWLESGGAGAPPPPQPFGYPPSTAGGAPPPGSTLST